MTPDFNVLLAAVRTDHPHHVVAFDWLERALIAAGRGEPMLLQPMVIASFLRLATHPKIFRHPTPMDAALNFLVALLIAPGVEQATLGAEWPVFRALCAKHPIGGHTIPAIWLAAAVIHQGEHLVSFDADFKHWLPRSRFTHLQP